MMGTTTAEVVALAADSGAAAVGANCGTSLESMAAIVAELSAAAPGLPLWVKPNAGLPRMTGDSSVYDVTPEQLGEAARGYVQAGARVVGGCCGSTPEHVRAIVEAIKRPGLALQRPLRRGSASAGRARQSTKRTRARSRGRPSAVAPSAHASTRSRDPPASVATSSLDRIAVDAGRDRREGDRAAAERRGDLERATVARGQQAGSPRVAAPPHRADRVHDVARREAARPSSPWRRPSHSRRAGGTRPGSPGRPRGEWRRRPRRRRAATRWRR